MSKMEKQQFQFFIPMEFGDIYVSVMLQILFSKTKKQKVKFLTFV